MKSTSTNIQEGQANTASIVLNSTVRGNGVKPDKTRKRLVRFG